MAPRYIIATSVCLLSSCATMLTPEGANVKLVTTSQKEKYCEMLDIVTSSNDMGIDSADDRRNAMNEARNEVARRGGNAMQLLSSSNENEGYMMMGGMLLGASEAVVQVEALICNMEKMRDDKKNSGSNLSQNTTKSSNVN
jgi:hypothetical protein